MKTIRLHFCECEHNGDLNNYKDDIQESGGRVVNSELNYEAETAWVDVEINDTFWEKFKKTDSYGFSN